MKGAGATAGDTGDSRVAMNVRVRVDPGTDDEVGGTVVEDFGDMAGHAVDIGENRIVGTARRWAVALDAAVWFSSTATSWSPSSFSCRGLPPVGRHLFQLRRRYRTIGCQPACRTPHRTLSTLGLLDVIKLSVEVRLIRLPGDAIGVPLLRAAAQAARGALRGPCCVRLSAWWSLPVVWR